MNREIKFRAFQNNQMLVSPISSNYGLQRFFGFLYEDAPIMEFTGIKDKNGKDIYDGDILQGGIFISYEVKWDHEECGWNISQNAKDFEVIGNIYENPELISAQ